MRWIIGALVVIGLGVAAWLLFDTDPTADAAGDERSAAGDAAPAEDGQDPRDPGIVTDRFVDPGSGDPAPATNDPDVLNPGFTLVVRAPDGKPIPGARVAVLRDGNASPGMTAVPVRLDVEYDRTADANGECDLSKLESGQWTVRAAAGDRIGMSWLNVPARSEPRWKGWIREVADGWKPEVVVEAVRHIDVTVLTRDGRPAEGIPVSVRDPSKREIRSHRIYSTRDLMPDCWAYSDAAGRVRFVAGETYGPAFFHARRFEVTAHVHGADPVKKIVAWDRPHGKAELRLESPVRALDVTVVDVDGKPSEEDTTLDWGVAEDLFARRTWSTDAPGGRVRLGAFVPGRTYGFNVAQTSRVLAQQKVEVSEGPGAQPVSLALGERFATVKLRLTYENGDPVAWGAYSVDVEGDADPGTRLDPWRGTQSFDAGDYSFGVKAGAEGKLVVKEASRGWPRREELKTVATFPIPPLKPEQEHDLGTTVVDRPPVLVAGRVVDASGRPVKAVTVSIRGQPEDRSPLRGPRSFSATQQVDDEGTFTFLGKPDPELNYTVRLLGTWAAAPRPVTPGTTDLVIQAVRRGHVSGRIRVVRPELREGLNVKLSGPAAEYPQTVFPRAQGYFTARHLAPGTYELIVTLGGYSGVEVLRIPGIVVEEGAHSRPTELADLKVGDGMRHAVVHVVDAHDQPIGGAYVQFRELPRTPGSLDEFETANAEGVASVWSRDGERLQVEVSSRGYIRRTLEPDRFPFVVRLVRPVTFTVELSSPLPATPPEGWALEIIGPHTPEELARRKASLERRRQRYPDRTFRPIPPTHTHGNVTLKPSADRATFRRMTPGARGRLLATPKAWNVAHESAPQIDLGPIEVPAAGTPDTIKVTISDAMRAALEKWDR